MKAEPATTADPAIKYVTHMVTKKSVTIVYKKDGKQQQKTFGSATDEFAEAQQLIEEGRKAELVNIVFAAKLANTVKHKVDINEASGIITLNGETLPPALGDRLKQFVKAQQDIDPLVNFWERLKKNPDNHSKEQLFRYIENHGITILEDGRFLLYKAVNHDMTSKHDNRTLHVVGEYVTLERSRCDSNPYASCSSGLHCAPYKYVTSVYGGRSSQKYLELIVDPEDMVSVPHDVNGQKMRVCRYLVNAIVNMDGVGIRTGLIARLDERPTDNAEKGSTMKAGVEHTEHVSPVLGENSGMAKADDIKRPEKHKQSLTAKGQFKRTPAQRKEKHDKKAAKKAAKKATKAAKKSSPAVADAPAPAKKASKKKSGPEPIKVPVSAADRTTFVGKFFADAGFGPKAKVAVGIAKNTRALIITPVESAKAMFKRHKAVPLGDTEVSLSDSCSLRLRNTVLREAGIRKKTLTLTYLEVNAISIG